MRELFDLVEAVAPSNANVLIQGENGTGKELIANAIHQRSPRADGPFIKINCAAIPKDLIESELFGYKKGAFTGANTDKIGLLEMAEGGALMLDEIGEMPPFLQTKLLRVLQEREYRPIGSDRFVKVDFRLICATNIDLDAALADGRLREDLYFRINTIQLRVPPLRERTEDIPLLCDWFVEKFARRHQKSVRGVSAAAYHLLIRSRWPGNVRELENAMERAVLVTRTSELQPGDLPDSIRAGGADDAFVIPPHRTLAEIEREFLDTARGAHREIRDTEDFETIARAAHRLKGASGMIGAVALGAIAAAVERAAIARDLPAVRGLGHALEQEVARVAA